ncbi:hypothetical protein RRG08_058660 [Elysia crispata]|uniref:Uncharacterized protein n=1 Tax=Elysia crispata TaxID=231223 RepID=A0AAE0YWI6_9GAST|nr:hypothetical protein RRG08_058660 [Elysia crispata]
MESCTISDILKLLGLTHIDIMSWVQSGLNGTGDTNPVENYINRDEMTFGFTGYKLISWLTSLMLTGFDINIASTSDVKLARIAQENVRPPQGMT